MPNLNVLNKSDVSTPGRPLEVTWEVTRKCNMECRACYTSDNADSPGRELSADEADRFLHQLADAGVLFLFFDGGEPLVRPDFLSLVESSTRKFCVFISINGTLVTQEVAERLSAAGVSAVFVGLQGATAEAHDRVTGVPGSFRETVTGIRNLSNAGVWTSAAIRLTRAALPQLPAYVNLAADNGAAKVSLLHLHRVGRARSIYEQQSPSTDELRAAIEHLYSQAPLPVPVSHPYYPFVHDCCREFCTVLWNGDVTTCTYVREWKPAIFGNIRDSSLLDIWNSERYHAYRTVTRSGSCQKCEFFGPCGGGCRAMPVAQGLTPYHSDPTCWYDSSKSNDPCKTAPSQEPLSSQRSRQQFETPRTALIRVPDAIVHQQPVWGQRYVYIPSQRRAVAMNEVAYAAWECLDGTLSPIEIADVVADELAEGERAAESLRNATLAALSEFVSLGCVTEQPLQFAP